MENTILGDLLAKAIKSERSYESGRRSKPPTVRIREELYEGFTEKAILTSVAHEVSQTFLAGPMLDKGSQKLAASLAVKLQKFEKEIARDFGDCFSDRYGLDGIYFKIVDREERTFPVTQDWRPEVREAHRPNAESRAMTKAFLSIHGLYEIQDNKRQDRWNEPSHSDSIRVLKEFIRLCAKKKLGSPSWKNLPEKDMKDRIRRALPYFAEADQMWLLKFPESFRKGLEIY